MTRTYKDQIIGLIIKHDRPLQAKELIFFMQQDNQGLVSVKVIRNVIMILCREAILAKVKVPGSRTFYCNPTWLSMGQLKKKYQSIHWQNKTKHVESKSISLQQPANRMGRIA